MESELIKIFNEQGNELGVATRQEVHKIGHWHETFHCWFIEKHDCTDYIYFQIRSSIKKDFPNLLDITAAGHILSHETVSDGVREIKEELGIDVSMEELTPLGIIKDCILTRDFIDREFGHVFLYEVQKTTDTFRLQREEVSGIAKAKFKAFFELCVGKRDEIWIEGFKVNEGGEEIPFEKIVNKDSFLPHESSYLEHVVKVINKRLDKLQ